MLTKLSWLALALIHFSPALVWVFPNMIEKLYSVSPGGEIGTLLLHRGILFSAIVALCILAAFHPPSRKAADLVVGISVIGFLILYSIAGFPDGALRKIAIADAIALLPLAYVTWAAFR